MTQISAARVAPAQQPHIQLRYVILYNRALSPNEVHITANKKGDVGQLLLKALPSGTCHLQKIVYCGLGQVRGYLFGGNVNTGLLY